jgi:hypothetical protein
VGGRLDHETRQRIRRARSDDRKSRAYRATRLDQELEREMTITSALICAGCQHPFRQHAFGGDCTLANCDCQRFVVADDQNGNGHQAVDVEPQQATKAVVWTRDEIVERIKQWAADHGEPPTRAQWEGPTTNDRPNTQFVAKRFGKWGDAIVAAGFPRPTKGTRRGSPVARAPKPPAEARTPDVSAAPEERQARPQPARAELKPPAPPPVAALELPTVELICLRLGDWELHRNADASDCKLYRGHDVFEDVDWQELLKLPTLIAAVGQVFGATGD